MNGKHSSTQIVFVHIHKINPSPPSHQLSNQPYQPFPQPYRTTSLPERSYMEKIKNPENSFDLQNLPRLNDNPAENYRSISKIDKPRDIPRDTSTQGSSKIYLQPFQPNSQDKDIFEEFLDDLNYLID